VVLAGDDDARNLDMTNRKISDFASVLEHFDTRWRKTPPVRIEWYKPPRRKTLPLLRYSVNPGKTMILKVMVLTADSEGPALISVALFQIDGRFMFDTTFDLDDAQNAITWLRRLFTEKSVVEVVEKNAEWAGSYCGRPGGHLPGLKMNPTFTRSWLGKHDTA
jgi:hypothetical protein